MLRYEIPSPFWYSETPADPSKEWTKTNPKFKYNTPAPPPGKKLDGRVSPFESAARLMKDINRDLGNMKIGDKSYVDLRMEDLGFTEHERKVALLTDDQRSQLTIGQIRHILLKAEGEDKLKELIGRGEEKGQEKIRQRFEAYANKLRDKIKFNKSLDELEDYPFEELGFSENQKQIALLEDAKILTLEKSAVLAMLEKEPEFKDEMDKLRKSDERDVRKRLQEYSEELRQRVNFNDLKNFIKKYLLLHIKDENRKNYLAEVIARNSALSGGIAYATSVYFWNKQNPLLDTQGFYADHLDKSIYRLGQPEVQVTISCDNNGEVKFQSTVQCYTIAVNTDGKEVKFFKSGDQIIDQGRVKMKDKMPLVKITNEFKVKVPAQVEVKKTNNFLPVKFETSPLKVERLMLGMESKRNPVINQFLSKVFSDTPLSGSAGVYLQKNKPSKESCQLNAIYVYKGMFGKLRYCALNEKGNRLITGSVPTGTILNQEAIKLLRGIAPAQATKLENFSFNDDEEGQKHLTALKRLAIAVSTIEYNPPKVSRVSLFGRSTQKTESRPAQHSLTTSRTSSSKSGSSK